MLDRYASALIALAYFACGALLYALDLATLVDGGGQPPSTGVRLLVLAAVCAPILLRRSHPVVALVVAAIPVAVDAALGVSLPVWLAYGDLLFAAALYGSARTSVVLERVPLALVGGFGVAVGLHLADLRVGVFAAAMGALLVVIPIWWARSVRSHRDAADAERAKIRALARVAELDRAAAVTAERQRLARDLHDIVAGHLSAIAIQSEAALRLRHTDPDRAVAVLASVRANTVDALQEMQTMVTLLRGDDVADGAATAGRLTNLATLVESAEAGGTPVTVDLGDLPDGALATVAADVDVTAYRIIQESLTNATKHAPGRPVHLRVGIDRDELTIVVSNPLGDTTGTGTGHGLRNIADRAAAVGGQAHAEAVAGRWRTEARLPLRHGSGAARDDHRAARRRPRRDPQRSAPDPRIRSRHHRGR